MSWLMWAVAIVIGLHLVPFAIITVWAYVGTLVDQVRLLVGLGQAAAGKGEPK